MSGTLTSIKSFMKDCNTGTDPRVCKVGDAVHHLKSKAHPVRPGDIFSELCLCISCKKYFAIMFHQHFIESIFHFNGYEQQRYEEVSCNLIVS